MERNNFPSHKDELKKFEANNKTIALNILCVLYNSKKIRSSYVSKHNLKRENQVILLTISNGEKPLSCHKKFVCIN